MQKISDLIARFPLRIALVAGGLSALGFAPWDFWLLTLVCFALLIHLIGLAPSGKKALLTGWLFGIGHFIIGNQWIAVAFTFQAAMPIWLGYVAVVALALFLAVYPAIAAWGAWRVSSLSPSGERVRERDSNSALRSPIAPSPLPSPLKGRGSNGLPLILAFAGFWVITEWLRSWVFTGFSWNPLSVVLVDTLLPQMFLGKIGTYGFSGIIILISGWLLWCAGRFCNTPVQMPKSGTWVAIVFGAIFVAPVAVATVYPQLIGIVFGPEAAIQSETSITIVQPYIPQAEKYAPGMDAVNFTKLARHSFPLPDSGPRLVLWPEAAIPDYLEEGYPYRFYQFQPDENAAGARGRLAQLLGDGDVLVTGANRLVIDKQGQLIAARNSASAVDANGRLLGHYDKAHLVPYGEYLPMPWLLRPLGLARLVPGELDFWPGPGARTMAVMLDGRPVKIGMQICYEVIFSGQVVDRNNRPDFIFNPSNDSWFGTIGPPQFQAQARLRAIEEGLPVVRSTPTGISAVIDADGRIVRHLGMGKSGRIDALLPMAKRPTLFARYGNVLPVGFGVVLIVLALVAGRRRGRLARLQGKDRG